MKIVNSIKKNIPLIAILFIFSSGFVLSENDAPSLADKLKAHIKFLAGEELQGRYPATDGNDKAAEYIISHLKSIGFQPIKDKYYQEFQFLAGVECGKSSKVSFEYLVEKPGIPIEMLKPVVKNWESGTDWIPIRFSDNGSAHGELVFAGYGISSAEDKYDDYEGIDVKGKIVIVLIDSSENKQSKNKVFAEFSELRYKARNARDHGASAVIFVKTQSDSANVFYPLKPSMGNKAGIIVVQANRTSLAKFFPPNQQLYNIEKEINKNFKPKSFLIPKTKVTVSVDIEPIEKPVKNVVAWIKGTDPQKQDEYVVIGAHFDHLGWGAENSMYHGKPAIHFGADDNASGTSAIMEIAADLAKKPLRRSVLFISFNAEEEGLRGSAYYVNNPLIPLEKTIFMLNLDMVGRMSGNELNVMGTGTSSGFARLVDSLSVMDSLTVSKASDGYAPSDQSSFYSKNIPVLFMFTSLHNDYHRPTDTWDKINYEGETQVVRYAEDILRTVANSDAKPDFIKVSGPAPQDSAMRKEGYGVWFGSVPNFEENATGLKISGTSAGSPAEKAGLKANDIIIKFGDKIIKNLYDLTYCLKEHQPGDVVVVRFVRGGKESEVSVTLEKRK